MKLMVGDRELRHAEIELSADGSIVLADGTIWSHAATLGPIFYRGQEFNIDRSVVESFINNFTTGYPQKVSVDYEHASTTDHPEVVKLRAQGKVPSAGSVAELRGVFSASDFTGDLKTAAEKLSEKAGRALDDPRNLGLWQRWKPTANALGAIKAEEYSELSIAFDDDWPDKTTGKGQGPTLLAVGLVSRPFLDDMLSVAASSDHGRSPAAPGSREGNMTKLTVLSVAAAVLGKAITSEDDALNELSALGPQLKELAALKPFRDVISAEFSSETDPAKIVGVIRELRAKVTQSETDAKTAKTAGIKTAVDATMEKHKAKLTVPLRELMAAQLSGELEGGAKLDDTKTVKALESMKALGIFSQAAAADVGGAGVDTETKLKARVDELMTTNDEVKELSRAKGRFAAFSLASEIAEREFETANA